MGLNPTTWRRWVADIRTALIAVPDDNIKHAAKLISDAKLTLVAGNGGSASLASHFAQACMKPTYKAGDGHAAVCLNDNIATWSAHINDGGTENALAECAAPFLDAVGARCVVVLISSSGNSKNILAVAKLAIEVGVPIIGMTGFDGGGLRALSTVALHVPSDLYEIVEPAHDFITHRVQALLQSDV